jgi:hypothetical protein
MDEATASKFGNYLQSNSKVLRVLPQCIPIFHNVKQALYQYNPSILYLSLSRMRYDHTPTSEIEEEIINGIYDIKKDNELNKVRIAVQTNSRTSSDFLRKLAMLRVSDIFVSQGQAGQMDRVAPQLSKAPSIENIKQYLTGSVPHLNIAGSDNIEENIGHYKQRVRQLERLLKIANSQINLYENGNNKIHTVPQKEYDQLLSQVQQIANSKLTDAKTKDLFAQVLNSKEVDAKKINRLSKIVAAQHEQLMDFNDQVQELEHKSKPEISYDGSYNQIPLNDDMNYTNEVIRPQNVNPRPEPRSNVNRTRDRGQPQVSKPAIDWAKLTKWAMIVVFGLFFVFGAFAVVHMTNSSKQQILQQKQPSCSSLIKKGKYVEAAKLYTDKGVEVENIMLSDPDIKDKAKIASGIAQYNDSDAIKFDNCYFNQEYSTASSIYNESNDSNLTNLIKARRIMVSYALMKDGQIAKAKSVAEPLNNSNLNERIKVFGQFYHANQILEAKIKHGHLTSEQITRAKKQIDDNQSAMDKL